MFLPLITLKTTPADMLERLTTYATFRSTLHQTAAGYTGLPWFCTTDSKHFHTTQQSARSCMLDQFDPDIPLCTICGEVDYVHAMPCPDGQYMSPITYFAFWSNR